ncbi:hypothetical protein D3C75_1215070 [compost metagenome]
MLLIAQYFEGCKLTVSFIDIDGGYRVCRTKGKDHRTNNEQDKHEVILLHNIFRCFPEIGFIFHIVYPGILFEEAADVCQMAWTLRFY